MGITGGSGRGDGTSAPEPPTEQVKVLGWGFSSTSDAQSFSHITGRVGSDVQDVDLILGDGTHVTASVAGGWFLAWWPGTQHATTIEVATTTGTHTQPAEPVEPRQLAAG